jgi:hypothetical protein
LHPRRGQVWGGSVFHPRRVRSAGVEFQLRSLRSASVPTPERRSTRSEGSARPARVHAASPDHSLCPNVPAAAESHHSSAFARPGRRALLSAARCAPLAPSTPLLLVVSPLGKEACQEGMFAGRGRCQRCERHGYRQRDVIAERAGTLCSLVGRVRLVHPDRALDEPPRFVVFRAPLELQSQPVTSTAALSPRCGQVCQVCRPVILLGYGGNWRSGCLSARFRCGRLSARFRFRFSV